MPKRILYIVPHRMQRSPGQRFRCEQYIPQLEADGFQITYSNLLSKSDDLAFYSNGRYFAKFVILIKSFFIRLRDVMRAPRYDIVFIYREAIMVGSSIFERLLRLSGAKIIFDFDDSIWLNDTSAGNQNLAWLKRPQKTNTIISLSHLTLAGNEYLAQYARKFSKNVAVMPTTIDLRYHSPKHRYSNTICIGWTGTSTTLRHFVDIVPILIKLKEKYGSKISFMLINNVAYNNDALELKTTPWQLHTEIEDLSKIDIGIMPLPNDQWANGKCGFKGLQYMSLGIPTIMSPVGVNAQIIKHSQNGFLANSPDDWFHYLSMLIENNELRHTIGQAGYETVKQHYSVQAHQQQYVNLFNQLIAKKQ